MKVGIIVTLYQYEWYRVHSTQDAQGPESPDIRCRARCTPPASWKRFIGAVLWDTLGNNLSVLAQKWDSFFSVFCSYHHFRLPRREGVCGCHWAVDPRNVPYVLMLWYILLGYLIDFYLWWVFGHGFWVFVRPHPRPKDRTWESKPMIRSLLKKKSLISYWI